MNKSSTLYQPLGKTSIYSKSEIKASKPQSLYNMRLLKEDDPINEEDNSMDIESEYFRGSFNPKKPM